MAELGSASVMAHVGRVDATSEGHAVYLQRWLSVMKQDRPAIVAAARDVGLACNRIIGAKRADAQGSLHGLTPTGRRVVSLAFTVKVQRGL